MTELALSPAGSQTVANPWVVAAIVVIPTFMEVLDTTITVVALRYIAGGLSATVDDGEWVITSYLAANAIILPITGGLSAHLGRRNYFLLSIAVFTLASALCGMSTSLGQLIVFRVVQGLAGGGLQPSSQSVLLDAFTCGEARHRDDSVWPCCPFGAGGWSDPRRLDHGQLFVALGVLHQRPGRSAGASCVLCSASGSGLSHEAAYGVEEAAVAF
ncbi:MAG: MFS transporter [Bradyrhizobium sp.]|nr:MFS transporter [Bradyrhizobium sp.]